MNKLFYIIYNSYYKHGKYKNDIPPLTVFGIFCVAIFSILNTVADVIYLIKDPTYFRTHTAPSPTVYFFISIIVTLLLFYRNKKYKKIYNKYKNVEKYDKIEIRIIAFSIIVMLIIFPILFALVYNKFYFGSWL